MDPQDILHVRFFFGGHFDFDGNDVQYVGGRDEMSEIERDKMSLPELRGFHADHIALTEEDEVVFHWLILGREMSSGLRKLGDDQDCLIMTNYISECEVADVYVEIFNDGRQPQGPVNVQITPVKESPEKIRSDIEKVKTFCSSSSQVTVNVQNTETDSEDGDDEDFQLGDEDCSEEDEDFQLGDEDCSEEDEEANVFRQNAQNQRRNPASIAVNQSMHEQMLEIATEANALEEEDEPPVIDSSEEASYQSDDGNEAIRRKSRFARYDNKAAIPIFSVGMIFSGRVEFKSALIKYGLATRRHLNFPKDEATRIRAKCSWKGCPWVILGSKDQDRFKVKTFNDVRVCPRRKNNRLVTGPRIADKYDHIIKANPSWKLQNIKETVLLEMGADVNMSKIKRAKAIVMRRIYEACKGEYAKLFEYQTVILRSNPGSTCVVCLDPEYMQPVFQRFYVCFDACKRGFLAGCRRVIGVDGCFFKGACNGELICALGRHSNNQIYAVAWAAVEKETEDSWTWFLGLLQKDLQIPIGGQGWVIISDQQKGLLNAVCQLFPEIEHRMCTRHIYANWRKKHRSQDYQKPFWMCAKASSVPFFNYCRAKLAQLTPDGAKDMMNTNPKHWSRAWFNLGSFCDSVDNNMCESFNNWIVDVRAHPIISMLEGIRTKVYVRIQQNRTKAERWTTKICPNILKKMNKYIDLAQNCSAIWNGKDGFEVRQKDKRYTVDIEKRTCSCRYWQLAGIPCAHAITSLYLSSKPAEDYIAGCYSVVEYNKIYDHCLLPMNGMEQWPTDERKPFPPAYVKMPGRPRKERRREIDEPKKATKASRVGTKIKCSKCHKEGHNSRSCGGKSNAKRRIFEAAKEVLEGSRAQNKPRQTKPTTSRAQKRAGQAQESNRPQKRTKGASASVTGKAKGTPTKRMKGASASVTTSSKPRQSPRLKKKFA